MICSKCKLDKDPIKNFEKWRTVCHSCKHKSKKKKEFEISVTEKECGKCKKIKLSKDFYPHRRISDGLQSNCKECHKEKVRKQYETRGHKIRKKTNEYYHNNKEELAPKRRAYHKRKMLEDPRYKMTRRLRSRLRDALTKKSWKKDTHFADYIGCTLDELKIWIENKFQSGMDWSNHGKWHYDHIIPLCSADTIEDLYKLCHYTNIQPLWAGDNWTKGGKILK